jgi:hypothetical protein
MSNSLFRGADIEQPTLNQSTEILITVPWIYEKIKDFCTKLNRLDIVDKLGVPPVSSSKQKQGDNLFRLGASQQKKETTTFDELGHEEAFDRWCREHDLSDPFPLNDDGIPLSKKSDQEKYSLAIYGTNRMTFSRLLFLYWRAIVYGSFVLNAITDSTGDDNPLTEEDEASQVLKELNIKEEKRGWEDLFDAAMERNPDWYSPLI